MNKVALLFPGQGSQYVGMGREIWNRYEGSQRIFEEASDAIQIDVKKLCFEGEGKVLAQTMNAQPTILTVCVSIYHAFKEELDFKPSFMAGHSLGEYTAMVCSGVLSFSDAIQLVRKRGILMQEADPARVGRMAAISGISAELLSGICRETANEDSPVTIACVNSNKQIVISGHYIAIESVLKSVEKERGTYTLLNVSAPFHSPLMTTASDLFYSELQKCTFNTPKCSLISNVSGQAYLENDSYKEKLKQQFVLPVRWLESINYMITQGVTTFIELGPRKVLTDFMKSIPNTSRSLSISDSTDLMRVKQLYSELPKGRELAKLKNYLTAALISRNRNMESTYLTKLNPLLSELKGLVENTPTAPLFNSEENAKKLLQEILKLKYTTNQEAKEIMEHL
ncbi:[acyl-carrier-protein] S-malonyltransferase [Paenibacillus sp. OK060]|uniref:ACP S-malonyltransferase n=1 Tax=Paenibacillus sp. OK060 TaxID=1881034 RepID=UPI000891EA60|nr:ACP S-malonyltransferase [Paenibacillus sp. OK060]SDM17306.1 [acyl-carrier-protein] S-malonyltransferase [Paenibacillus sp. OK060]